MANDSGWDFGTVVWMVFGVLLMWGLLCQLCMAAFDTAATLREWIRDRHTPAPAASKHETTPAEGEDHFSWDDAQTVSFQEPEPGAVPAEPPILAVNPDCPRCGCQMVPVVYGFPWPETVLAAEEGSVILGGCAPGQQRHACRQCPNAGWLHDLDQPA